LSEETKLTSSQMANYTFTSSSCYALSTHDIILKSDSIVIKLSSTNQIVYTKLYSNGVDVMCSGDDFCVGTLNENGVFSETINFANADAKIWLVETSGENTLIGSNDETDAGIYHKYDLNQCPVRLKKGPRNSVKLECPCESASGTCDNGCYSYGI